MSDGRVVADSIYRLKDPLLNYRQFSGHSLSRGFLTSAAKCKVDLLKMIAKSLLTRVGTVLAYVDDPKRFDNHAAEHLLERVTMVRHVRTELNPVLIRNQ